ncbi:MAG: 23S rRNA (adenine(2030)-N(6))-methyltransferase RlmJ [Bacillaceae bacterium]|nr:23S rRNA (adenine(2030)-N(6))-methyltransferase RlmJ [Bacillaceae bacterium]
MSMNNKAGNFGDVTKHFFILELLQLKLKSAGEDAPFLFYDAFGGNIVTDSCREEAIRFYQTVRQHDDPQLGQSIYYHLLPKCRRQQHQLLEYYGSTKLALELFKQHDIPFKIIYNSYDRKDVTEAISTISGHPDATNMAFHHADAYRLIADYRHVIRAYPAGVLFFDPYWKETERDLQGCITTIRALAPELKRHPNWTFVLWVPYQPHEQNALQLKKAAESCLLSAEIHEIRDASGSSGFLMQGVGMVTLNPPGGLKEYLLQRGYDRLGWAIGGGRELCTYHVR